MGCFFGVAYFIFHVDRDTLLECSRKIFLRIFNFYVYSGIPV